MRKIRYKDVTPEMKRISEPNFVGPTRSSLGLEKFMGEYFFIDVQRLVPYQHQARKVFNEEEIQKLSETIQEHGIRQPLTVLRSSLREDVFEVVSGERRLRAAKLIGLKKVPCIIIEDENQAAEIALIENIQRQNLHPIELARSINNLVLKGGHGNQTAIARKLGMSKSQLSETLKVLDLSDDILDEMLKHNVRGREHFRKLLTLGDELGCKKYLNNVLGIKSVEPLQKALIARSVLRISFGDNGIKVQKAQLKNLSAKQLQEIVRTLEQIVSEWKQ